MLGTSGHVIGETSVMLLSCGVKLHACYMAGREMGTCYLGESYYPPSLALPQDAIMSLGLLLSRVVLGGWVGHMWVGGSTGLCPDVTIATTSW